MAGGGVGEAMAIGALMGAGTGGVMAAAQDKDPVQGALLGAVTGAATGSLGAGLGSAGTELAKSAGTQAVEQGVTQELSKEALSQGIQSTLAQNAGQTGTSSLLTGAQSAATPGMTPTVGQMMQQSAQAAGSGAGMTPASLLGPGGSSIPGVGATSGSIAGTGGGVAGGTTGGATSGGIADAAKWMGGGKGEGWATGLTNAQAYGAGLGGGVGGAYSAGQMPGEQSWPTESEDSSSLSYFNYDPTKYRAEQPSPRVYEANYRGMADGGIASLNPMSPMSNSVYPQSQQTQTAFSTSPQYPNSMRSAMASDYDARTNPTLGTEMPMGYADGGGIGFIRNLQPGGAFGDMSADVYGAQVNALPFLKDVEPGGFLGATTPGRMDYMEREQRKKDEEDARKRSEQEASYQAAREIARNTGMNSNMARGGIASLGGYSDGGRLLRGPGDGVSDSIPASIGGRQPARLADGEFVVPSRIVSELGNGSTDAGARRLYDMMDRVQRRRGTTVGKGKVAKNTKAYQELPA